MVGRVIRFDRVSTVSMKIEFCRFVTMCSDYDRSRLPDLLVHPSFYEHVCTLSDVRSHLNVMEPAQLTVSVDTVASVVCADGRVLAANVELEPYYEPCIGNGVRPNFTSYTFARRMPMYRVAERAPRYVIWTEADPLPVCATVVARTDLYGLSDAVRAAVDWSRIMVITKTVSVAVFDLDRTLIDDEDRFLDGAVSVLEHARTAFDAVVLWSHGSPLHVDRQVGEFKRHGIGFDLVLSNAFGVKKSCKNLLYLYNHFVDTYFSKAVLIDDSVFNWTPEYTHCIVPTAGVRSVVQITRALDRC